MITQSGSIVDLFSREEQIMMALNTPLGILDLIDDGKPVGSWSEPPGIINLKVAKPYGMAGEPNILFKPFVSKFNGKIDWSKDPLKQAMENLKNSLGKLDTDE